MPRARMCGALEERTPYYAARCWCYGLFCAKGGYKRGAEFRRDFRTKEPVMSRAQFEDVARQMGLFDGNEVRDKWVARIESHEKSARQMVGGPVARRRRAQSTEASHVG